MVNVETPVGAEAAIESVRTLVPVPGAAMLGDENEAVTPLGSVPADKAMGRLKPLVSVPVVTVSEAVPGVAEPAAGI